MHPEEVLLTLSALTGDERFEDIILEVKGEEEPRMCELIDRYEKRGEKRGERRGEKRGREMGAAREIVLFGEDYKLSAQEIMERLMSRLGLEEGKAAAYYERYRRKA